MEHKGCFTCGKLTTHMQERNKLTFCPACAVKYDKGAKEEMVKLLKGLADEQNKPKVMQHGCTCCPVHGPGLGPRY